MGNGVVHVQYVQTVDLSHLRHASRQRQIVGRVFEQGILRDRHFVKEDWWKWLGLKADGLLIGDEMTLVPAGGQFDAKLRANHATAAVSGITGDSDFH